MPTVRENRSTAQPTAARGVAVAAIALLAAASCQARGDEATPPGGSAGTAPAAPTTTKTPPDHPPVVRFGVAAAARDVDVDTVLTVRADGGRLTGVSVRPAAGSPTLSGAWAHRRTSWRASERLEPGTTYRMRAAAVDGSGQRSEKSLAFRTADLSLDEQTYPVITPAEGQTVGVGMPAIVRFDVPVTNRAAIERHLHVTSTPQVEGSWHWVNDNEVHWRPKRLWPAGAKVRVEADINGVDAGNGIYGQLDRAATFTVGRSVISKVNVRSNHMRVFVEGKLARTIPVTAGKPGFETRGGTKLIVEKFETLRMNAATVGIKPSDPEYYDIPDVRYAMRLTYSGEFLHAAPWSVPAQGKTNVSHGCVGMSVANARWLYQRTHIGDVVRVAGSDRPLEDGNGWTDWDVSYREYAQGSALS